MNSFSMYAQEVCGNGKDDDNDGLIDLYDPDCQCHQPVKNNLLLNGSFELHDHCPVNYTYDADYKIADYWQYGTYTNVGEAIFYHNLQCTYDSTQVALNMPPAQPLPDGSAFMGVQNNTFITPIPEPQIPKTYFGQCLQKPLQKGVDYVLNFYAGRFKSWDNFTGKIFSFTVAIFGNTNCNAAPFGKKYASGNGCPANYVGWVLLGKVDVSSNEQWVQSKISFTAPDNISVIEIGPDCNVLPPINDLTDSTTFLDYHVYYLDDLQLFPAKDSSLELIHAKTGNTCTNVIILQAPVYLNASYQWYKDSIAIVGATNDTYTISDTSGMHNYNAIINVTGKCIATEPFLITASKLNEIKIPKDSFVCGTDALLLVPPVPGITYTSNGITGDVVNITNAGSYTITATDIYGCEKVFNTTIVQQNCAECTAYLPTAFTPNDDGLNDVFKPKLDCFPAAFNIKIFNRWGQKIFESTDVNKGWEGSIDGRKALPGTYVYFINYKTRTGVVKTAKGMFVLIL